MPSLPPFLTLWILVVERKGHKSMFVLTAQGFCLEVEQSLSLELRFVGRARHLQN